MANKLQGAGVGWWNTPIPIMLSYIGQQHCQIVAFSRCLIFDCRMAAFKVVGVDILPDGNADLRDVIVLRQISFFVLEAAEPSLNHNVICPPAFPVHILADSIFLYEVNVLLTYELTSLIRIQGLRFRYFEGLFQGVDHQEYHLPPNRQYSGCTSRSRLSDTEILAG